MNQRSLSEGGILVQAAILLFGLMATAAVIVDLGIARVTQGNMQVAADSASLAGLRNRDAFGGSPAQADLARRAVASRTAASLFDEDLDSSTANVALILGAGPTIDTGVRGVSDPAGGLLTTSGPYVPSLQLNGATNVTEGDLVAGSFSPNRGFADWHNESAGYLRTDFASAAATDAPSAPAFLARLRRTHGREGLDRQPGISSAGPSLPFLFGLGSPLGATNAEVYDPRRDGITVRATAIADARPALAAGIARAGLAGVISVGTDAADPAIERVVAFQDASWRASVALEAPFAATISVSGEIAGDATTPGLAGFAVATGRLVRVGDIVTVTPSAVALTADPSSMIGTRYFALYEELVGSNRITGF
ncbi:MAG: hypothetical protein AAF368_06480, partial [Planctomycetota bacterium]